MKARNKVDMLASLLEELEPKDIELLDYTYIKPGLAEVMHSIVKRANEKNYYYGIHESVYSQQIFNMIDAFQLGYMIGKREERMKHKISKA